MLYYVRSSERIFMSNIAIILDSTCDMTIDLLDKYDLDYVPMGFSFDDKEFVAYLDWKEISVKDFYATMKKTRIYTSQVSEATFEEKFNKLVSEGKEVLYIACSSGLSKSIDRGRIVASRIMKENPKAKIVCIDSLISGMGQGMIGIYAASLRDEGKSIDEIASAIESEKLKFNQWGTVDDLNYLKRAGRVKASAAFFGNIFGVKPIIISDIHGDNFAYKKVRGREDSMKELADSVVRTIVDPENHYVAISHGDCEEDAYKIKEMIEKQIKVKGFFITPLGPALGASCGPKTLIAFNYGPEVTLEGK